ncbi:MAG TPA: MarR family transcriptional regulator [Caulobacteraceae bacterium]
MASKSKVMATAERLPDDGGLSELDDILGFHIRLAHGAVYRHFTETFSDVDLTQKQVSVLWLVSEYPGISQAELGRRLQIDRATMMAIVNRVQARGYLVRGASKVDGRRQTLTLTPEGVAALIKSREAIRAHEKWLKGRFTDAEVSTLINLLRAIHE